MIQTFLNHIITRSDLFGNVFEFLSALSVPKKVASTHLVEIVFESIYVHKFLMNSEFRPITILSLNPSGFWKTSLFLFLDERESFYFCP